MTKVEGIILDIIPTNDAVQKVLSQSLEVYPNPASDVLYIDNLPCKEAEYAVFNVMGQKVGAGTLNGKISVAEFEEGLYVLQIKGEKFLETTKFIVK